MEPAYLLIVLAVSSFAYADTGHTACRKGQFKLSNMEECSGWLKCSDLKGLQYADRIGLGSTKIVHLAFWNDQPVAVSQLTNENHTADFQHGLEMLELLSPSPNVVQLVGFCKNEHMFVTEYHKLGNATGVLSLIKEKFGTDNVIAVLRLCLNYARLLEFLHDGPAGTRVMCDSNDLDKLLSQILVTDQFELILNDLDALPLVEKSLGKKIKCGNRELSGDFVAPEQRWPYTGTFRAAAMPGYDEKTDIWKAGDVFKSFMSILTSAFTWVQYRMFNLIRSCKYVDPVERPTAKYLVSVLEKMLAELALVKTEF